VTTEDIDIFDRAARAAGLKMIRDARSDSNPETSESSLLAWNIYDEPEAAGFRAPPRFGPDT
jgi:hypothetical protein